MDKQTQTLCIPRVKTNISESHIRKILEELELGKIEGIDIVSKNKEKYNRVFVHLRWNNLENALLARELLASGKDIKVFYDEFWFWKLSAYREPENRRKKKPNANAKPDANANAKPDANANAKPDANANAKPDVEETINIK